MKQPKEIEFKRWLYERANELEIDPSALRMRIKRGKYPMPAVRKVNSRVLMVMEAK